MKRIGSSPRPLPSTLSGVVLALAVCLVCGLDASAQDGGVSKPVPPASPLPDESPAEVDPADASTKLPPNFKPPRTPHPTLLITEELVPEIGGMPGLEWFKRNRPQFQRAMNNGDLGGANKKIVENGLAVMVLRLSLAANRRVLPDVRSEIKRTMDRAGTLQKKPNAKRQFREFVLDQVIDNCEKLLSNNLEVRLSAMILLNNAYIEIANPIKNLPAEFYEPTAKTFMAVLKDDKQHPVVRIWAAKGLEKVLAESNIRNQGRSEIAEVLVDQLVPARNDPWLDMRIAEAAGQIGIVRYGGQKPIVVEALAKVLNDDTRDCLVRSEAAKQLARLKPDPSYNLTLFAHQTVRLVNEMAAKQAKNPLSAKWRVCFLNAYLAFLPVDVDERNAKQAGLLVRSEKTAHEKYVKDALNEVLPAVTSILGENWSTAIDGQKIAAMDAWLKDNPPSDWKATPDSDALDVRRVAEKDPEPKPAG